MRSLGRRGTGGRLAWVYLLSLPVLFFLHPILVDLDHVSARSTPAASGSLGTVTLIATGDVLMHRAVKRTARENNQIDEQGKSSNNGGHDILWGAVAALVRSADIAFANLETPLAPKSHRGIWGEVFNAPAAVAASLADAGFDVLSFANNHTFDQGGAGLVETVGYVRAAGVQVVGAGETCAAARRMAVLERGGLRFGFLAMADLMNIDDNPLDGADGPCTFVAGPRCRTDCGPSRDAIFYRTDLKALRPLLRRAKAQVDVLVLSCHWGIEYAVKPLPLYPPLAKQLVDAGVDVVLGHHPHVLQPVEYITAADGRRALVVYSLGNFISNMAASYRSASPLSKGNTRDGVLLQIDFRRQENGAVGISAVKAHLLWTENNDRARRRGQTRDTLVRVVLLGENAVVQRRRAAHVQHILNVPSTKPRP